MIPRPPISTLFPTRRSSDLITADGASNTPQQVLVTLAITAPVSTKAKLTWDPKDRKSTRLNSSHQIISYAVFCLKKKTTENGLTATSCIEDKIFRHPDNHPA